MDKKKECEKIIIKYIIFIEKFFWHNEPIFDLEMKWQFSEIMDHYTIDKKNTFHDHSLV